MVKLSHLPSLERLSTIASVILLVYTLSRFITIPDQFIRYQLLGFYFEFNINIRVLVVFMVICITVSGVDWMLRNHPFLEKSNTFQHWLLPALTAWVIGFPLFQLPLGPYWWASIILGGALLITVLVSEYITVDPDDIRQPIAAVMLTSISFSIFLILGFFIHYVGVRLVLMLPALFLASGLVSMRTLNLRLPEKRAFTEAGIIALLSCQFAAGLHYWPISAFSFGLALLGFTYALTSFIANLADSESLPLAIIEPALVTLVLFGFAYWYR
ncbi:MAG: hypothetical protein JW908_00940 [Anaerolineales bacterium]|nr:hypothetical protein [Anaerolineales bacterium]